MRARSSSGSAAPTSTRVSASAVGDDDTLFALVAGKVEFARFRGRRAVNIVPLPTPEQVSA